MSLNVLIIEDEGIIGIDIKRVVTSMGHKVLMVVKSSSDALKIAQKNKIDLLISDTNIQGNVDAIECCSIMQSHYNVAVIFVTGYRDMQRVKTASNVDFLGCLEKPFREDELETMINLAI